LVDSAQRLQRAVDHVVQHLGAVELDQRDLLPRHGGEADVENTLVLSEPNGAEETAEPTGGNRDLSGSATVLLVRGPSLDPNNPEIKRRFLWRDIVPGESWFVSARYRPAGGGAGGWGGGAGAPAGESSASGLGDVTLSATYEAYYDAKTQFGIDLTGKIKLATADPDERLGTGEHDLGVAAEIYKSFGRLTVFAGIGYTQFAAKFHIGAMPTDLIEKSIRLFGEEVIPAFR
jgi:hypothetical protein